MACNDRINMLEDFCDSTVRTAHREAGGAGRNQAPWKDWRAAEAGGPEETEQGLSACPLLADRWREPGVGRGNVADGRRRWALLKGTAEGLTMWPNW